ncbi:MAG: alpha/beta hydrolase, partial [Victivallales bacterium]|nr:alpha/beta hydrolase [Victivallales bacterium]
NFDALFYFELAKLELICYVVVMRIRGTTLRLKLRRVVLYCLAVPCVLFILIVCVAGCFADKVIFQPPDTRAIYSETMLDLAPGIDISLRFTPPPNNGYVLLYSHGNAEDLWTIRYLMEEYSQHGYGVAAYDYEGYGHSGGKPSEAAAYRDIECVWNYLTAERKISPKSIVIYGRSVGSGPACYLAEKVDAKALVLEAPFTSTFAVAGLGFLPFNRFVNIDRIDKINMPLLIIHGDKDRIVPYSHGKKLFSVAKEPKQLYTAEGAGHNNIIRRERKRYWQTLKMFLNP